jgi:hypothetical protein
VTELLISRAAMLEEYFMLKITPHGDLTTLPIILRGWAPNLDGLPGFLLHLATKVRTMGPLPILFFFFFFCPPSDVVVPPLICNSIFLPLLFS